VRLGRGDLAADFFAVRFAGVRMRLWMGVNVLGFVFFLPLVGHFFWAVRLYTCRWCALTCTILDFMIYFVHIFFLQVY